MDHDLCFKYDIARLNCYDKLAFNHGKINIQYISHGILLSFKGVNYFNYVVCNNHLELQEVLLSAKLFYSQLQIINYRLLIEETAQDVYHPELNKMGYVLKNKQSILHFPNPFHFNVTQPTVPGIVLELVSHETIAAFTHDYLVAFDSMQKDIANVILNFSQLLENKEISLFRILHNNYAVGIAALYTLENSYLFAGGAVLPFYRNKGYHTNALLLRLQECLHLQTKHIIAWAYQQSQSYNNMINVGFIPYKTYSVYEK